MYGLLIIIAAINILFNFVLFYFIKCSQILISVISAFAANKISNNTNKSDKTLFNINLLLGLFICARRIVIFSASF
jgi:hypothetical protein